MAEIGIYKHSYYAVLNYCNKGEIPFPQFCVLLSSPSTTFLESKMEKNRNDLSHTTEEDFVIKKRLYSLPKFHFPFLEVL